MTTYHDLSLVTDSSYKLAEIINKGKYNNILYYEFHEVVDPKSILNCYDGFELFSERTEKYYDVFMSYDYVDNEPANIHIAIKIADEWFIAKDCGANYYVGYGPTGIIKLREACSINNIAGFVLDDKFEDWLILKFGSPKKLSQLDKKNTDQIQFVKLIKKLQYLVADMQRRPSQYQGLKEEDIRDRLLSTINAVFNGRGNAEAKNCNGKTDILVRTLDGKNEHVFELKVWKGIQSLEETIAQLQSYLSWHNNYAGIIMFCYKSNYSQILDKVEKHLIANYNFKSREKYVPNEFRFHLNNSTDKFKAIEVHLMLVNLKIPKS